MSDLSDSVKVPSLRLLLRLRDCLNLTKLALPRRLSLSVLPRCNIGAIEPTVLRLAPWFQQESPVTHLTTLPKTLRPQL